MAVLAALILIVVVVTAVVVLGDEVSETLGYCHPDITFAPGTVGGCE